MPQKWVSPAVLATDRVFFVIIMDSPKCVENIFGGEGKIPDIFFSKGSWLQKGIFTPKKHPFLS